jgi:phosphate transport system protein
MAAPLRPDELISPFPIMDHTPPPRHILGSYEQALESLRANILMMAGLALRGLGNAERGLFERDLEACQAAIADDEEIDALEVQIDRDGVEALIKFHPVARDMRQIISAMKMSGNLERIGDHAVGVARRARKLNQYPPLPETEQMRGMFRMATGMVSDAVAAFADGNVELARGMKARDRELDQVNKEMTNLLATRMADRVDELRGYLNLIFIARILERIGDLATNLCEDVVFVQEAEDIRHRPPGVG